MFTSVSHFLEQARQQIDAHKLDVPKKLGFPEDWDSECVENQGHVTFDLINTDKWNIGKLLLSLEVIRKTLDRQPNNEQIVVLQARFGKVWAELEAWTKKAIDKYEKKQSIVAVSTVFS